MTIITTLLKKSLMLNCYLLTQTVLLMFKKKILRHKMRRIQAKKHKLGTYKINKISLLCFDDERSVLENGIHTLAYFYKDIDSHR